MKKSIVTLLLMFMGIMCGSQNASAQSATSAYYTWSVENIAAGEGILLGLDDIPTQTGLNNAPFLSPFSGIGNGQTATATQMTQANSVTGTAFLGEDLGSPFDHNFECAFTINNPQVIDSNGNCTAPTGSANAVFGTSSTRPMCTFKSVTETSPCNYTVNFTWGFQ